MLRELARLSGGMLFAGGYLTDPATLRSLAREEKTRTPRGGRRVRVAPRDVHHGPGGRLRVALVLPAPRRPPCRGFRVAEDSPVDAVEFVRVGSRSKADLDAHDRGARLKGPIKTL